MKKKLLTTAILAGIAGTVNAVNIDPDGLGEVLIYPYYTVQNGNNTLISVVNSTDRAKALKVRILEGKNSREVLDFNLYLSPFDVWTAAIVPSTVTRGGRLITTDTSCTVPPIPAAGVDFRNFQYTGSNSDSRTNDGLRSGESVVPPEEFPNERTREGYVEIFEMGVLSDEASPSTFTPATWSTHTSAGIPNNCGRLNDAWRSGGQWSVNGTRAVSTPRGGLFGGGLLINVQEGIDASYNATALDGFFRLGSFHTPPASIIPNLASVDIPQSLVFDRGSVVSTTWRRSVNATSALFMHDAILNEFVLDTITRSGTDWVINFPTKAFYVDGPVIPFPFPPFTRIFANQRVGAAEAVTLNIYDREERTLREQLDFSPPPPTGRNEILWEVNVVTFNNTRVLQSDLLGSNINTDFQNGWLRISFDPARNVLDETTNLEGHVYRGLPSIGFAVMDAANGTIQIPGQSGSVLSNYMNLFNHRFTRNIVTS